MEKLEEIERLEEEENEEILSPIMFVWNTPVAPVGYFGKRLNLTPPTYIAVEDDGNEAEWVLVGKKGRSIKPIKVEEFEHVQNEDKENEEEKENSPTSEQLVEEVEVMAVVEIVECEAAPEQQQQTQVPSPKKTKKIRIILGDSLKKKIKLSSRRFLQRTNQVYARHHVTSKKNKQVGRMQGKIAGLGGRRCGWY